LTFNFLEHGFDLLFEGDRKVELVIEEPLVELGRVGGALTSGASWVLIHAQKQLINLLPISPVDLTQRVLANIASPVFPLFLIREQVLNDQRVDVFLPGSCEISVIFQSFYETSRITFSQLLVLIRIKEVKGRLELGSFQGVIEFGLFHAFHDNFSLFAANCV